MLPRESKNQALPIGSGESFICIILKAILCLVLDFQGVALIVRLFGLLLCNNKWGNKSKHSGSIENDVRDTVDASEVRDQLTN